MCDAESFFFKTKLTKLHTTATSFKQAKQSAKEY